MDNTTIPKDVLEREAAHQALVDDEVSLVIYPAASYAGTPKVGRTFSGYTPQGRPMEPFVQTIAFVFDDGDFAAGANLVGAVTV